MQRSNFKDDLIIMILGAIPLIIYSWLILSLTDYTEYKDLPDLRFEAVKPAGVYKADDEIPILVRLVDQDPEKTYRPLRAKFVPVDRQSCEIVDDLNLRRKNFRNFKGEVEAKVKCDRGYDQEILVNVFLFDRTKLVVFNYKPGGN